MEEPPQKTENIKLRIIEEEMKQSYLNYSMSVIVGRALPDARDGLKPVHRRILFSMNENGMLHNKPFKKSARIVGDTLGKYHPHGDMAVYDSLVRMAQDFSLRYLLIQGQGNFGCFTKDTKVALTDGRSLSFGELIEEYKKGKRSYTHTINSKGDIEVAEIKNPRLTKKNQRILNVVLDNNEEIKCTLNHKFMLRDGTYKEAKDLKPGDSLMPAYFRSSTKEDDANAIGYNMILQPKLNSWSFVHILSDKWNLEKGVYKSCTGRIRHHLDFNKLNNNPDNIRRMHWKDHWKSHYDFTSLKHKTDAEYRKKLAEGREKFWADERNRKNCSKRLTDRNLKNWKNEEYRKKMKITLSEINKKYLREHPEIVEKIRKTASITMKRLWKIPRYKELFHNKITASNKRRETNLTGKKKFLKICQYLNNNNIHLNKENYEKIRKEVFGIKSFTSWDLGIEKYYSGNQSLLMCEMSGNHKIIRIEFLKDLADVYDLTIDKTHNFSLASGVFVHNSIDGDPPASMRYTEARLTQLSEEMLQDIDKETVKFTLNFDASLQEPTVLPSKLPNLLVNGSSGIAVGMATNIPPHNLNEISDGITAQIDDPDVDILGLMQHIKGPDFPTGAMICNQGELVNIYSTGRGHISVRAKTEIEEGKRRIIITEIPYMVNKSQLIEQIAELVRDKKIRGISDLRDESDREGLRVVVELAKDSNPQIVLNQLFAHSRLQVTFGVIMLALVNNEPKILNLKQLIQCYIDHRKNIVTKRTQFDLTKAQKRSHILEGMIIALNNIDPIISLIKKSKEVEDAKQGLISNYSLTEEQAAAILDMKLQRLTSLERGKIKEEQTKLLVFIEELKSILASEQKISDIIKKELQELKEKYGDSRKTELMQLELTEFSMEDIIKPEDMVITITHSGYIKRQPIATYRSQHRGGKGMIATQTKEEDFVDDIFIANTHSYILFFTNKGAVYWLKVYNIPEASRTAQGKAIVNLLRLEKDENITAHIPVGKFDNSHFLVMATKKGIIKKTNLIQFQNPRSTGIIACDLREGDELIGVELTDGQQQIILATRNGMAVKFEEQKVRSMGRTATGVRGITLKDNDEVIGAVKADDKKTLLTITENGFGKGTAASEYRLTNRGGIGVRNIICSERNGKVVAIIPITEDDELIFISRNGIVLRTQAKEISIIGRATQGSRIMKLAEKDALISAARIIREHS